jgi:nucleotide-binding universal stress UspA family protein
MSCTVLVCTDGSHHSIAAAVAGLSLLPTERRVVITTVVADPALSLPYDASGTGSAVMIPVDMDQTEHALQEAGADIVARTAVALDLTDYQSRILVGDAGRGICELAEEVGASVVVIGSRGHGGLKRALLGSVSDHVVRHAPCPVLVSPAP